MTLYDLINKFKDTSLKHVLVNEFGEGDIYEYLNSREHKYPCVFLTITGISDNDYDRGINCTLFYVDRLTSDSSNKKQVQSTGLNVLSEILSKFNTTSTSYTPFTEKFSDLCAGVFAETNISIELDFECGDNFKIRNKYIVENGTYDVENIDEVTIECPSVDEYIDEIERLEDEVQVKDKLINSVTSLEITENGTYIAPEGTLGYNNISVNTKFKIPNGTKLGYSTVIDKNLDFSDVTDFSRMFYQDENAYPGLLEAPEIDTSNGINFYSFLQNANKIKSIPNYNLQNATNVQNMFKNCSLLETIENLNTNKCKAFDYCFENCVKLKSVKNINTDSATSCVGMFSNCRTLKAIPLLNLSNCTAFYKFCYYCFELTDFPKIDVSNATNVQGMFYECRNIEYIPELMTDKITNFTEMFCYCYKLHTVEKLNFSTGVSFGNMFRDCSELQNITLEGSINYKIDFSYSSKLTYESVKSILTACSNTTRPTISKTLKFNLTHIDQNGELAALVADCNTKSWTISGLTLN